MSLSNFQSDPAKEAEGIEHDFGDGFVVKIAAWENEKFKKLRDKLQAPFKNMMRMGQNIPDEKAKHIFNQLIAETIITDWKGAKDPASGKEIPYSKAITVVENPQYHRFVEMVIGFSSDTANYKLEAKEAAAKN